MHRESHQFEVDEATTGRQTFRPSVAGAVGVRLLGPSPELSQTVRPSRPVGHAGRVRDLRLSVHLDAGTPAPLCCQDAGRDERGDAMEGVACWRCGADGQDDAPNADADDGAELEQL